VIGLLEERGYGCVVSVSWKRRGGKSPEESFLSLGLDQALPMEICVPDRTAVRLYIGINTDIKMDKAEKRTDSRNDGRPQPFDRWGLIWKVGCKSEACAVPHQSGSSDRQIFG
jgi:hypothetical protein